MTKYRPYLLALACLGLGVIAWLDNREAIVSLFASPGPIASQDEARVDKISKDVPADGTPAEHVQSSEVASLLGNPLADFDKTELENWVERPLFAPSRKPPPEQELQTESGPRPSPPHYQLLGVVLEEKSAIAVLRRESTGAGVRVQVGDMIEGWLVAAVEREAVTLKRDEEEPQILRFKKACSKSAGTTCP